MYLIEGWCSLNQAQEKQARPARGDAGVGNDYINL